MLSELQQRKLQRLFQLLDFNQDGHIDRSDFEMSVGIFAQMRGLASDSPDYQTFYDECLARWEDTRQADMDGDGRVTLAEYLAHQAQILGDEEIFNRSIGKTARAFLTAMDNDGDGMIQLKEFMAGHAAFQVNAATSESIFHMIDTDGDQAVGYDEMVVAVRSYYYSADPADPMNNLMGPY